MTTELRELEKLYARPYTFKIPKKPKKGQEQALVVIQQIDLNQAADIDIKKDAPVSEVVAKAKKLFAMSTGCKEEDIGHIAFAHLKELMDCIAEVNNFSKEEMQGLNTMKDFLKQKRAQIEEQKAQNKNDQSN